MERPPLARGVVAGLAAAKLLLHLPFLGQYGWFRDELYYVASTDHLAFGYVDHPPLSIALLALTRFFTGDSLYLLRLPAVAAGVASIALVCLAARELGGGRFAQGMAGLVALASPVWMGMNRYYSMNAIDLLVWCGAALLFARILQARGTASGNWLALGLLLGLGLMNKLSVLNLGLALLVGLVVTPRRRDLATPWPWLAGLVSILCVAPFLLWQMRHGWPTLEFMSNAARLKNVAVGPLELLSGSALEMNPLAAPVLLLGFLWGLGGRAGPPGRALGVVWLAVYAALAASGTAKVYYLATSYAFLIPLAAVAAEALTGEGSPVRWLRSRRPRLALPALVVAGGALLAPFALPILAPDRFAGYSRSLGVTPGASERHQLADLPQHFADMFGWQELATAVAAIHDTLPAGERSRCVVYGQNYGEAGAIDVLGRKLGLPRAVSGHNSYWFWGPGPEDPAVVIIIGGDEADNREVCGSLTLAGTFTCDRCMPYENDTPLFICRDLKLPIAELWPRLREFI